MNDPALDREIDRTIRRMLDVSPSADLRARVLAGIRVRRQRITWARVALATAAALVLAALLRDAPAPAPAVGVTETAQSAPTRVPPAVSPPPAEPSAAGQPAVRVPPRVVAQRTPRTGEPLPPPLPATPDDFPPIEVGEVVVAPPDAPAAIEPPEIVIAPLAELADVAVEPLPFPRGARL